MVEMLSEGSGGRGMGMMGIYREEKVYEKG